MMRKVCLLLAILTSPCWGQGGWPATESPSINVRAFGAKGDGVVDDAAAFQAAINSSASGASVTVVVPSGTYLLNASPLANGRFPLFLLQGTASTTGAGSLPGAIGYLKRITSTDSQVSGFTFSAGSPGGLAYIRSIYSTPIDLGHLFEVDVPVGASESLNVGLSGYVRTNKAATDAVGVYGLAHVNVDSGRGFGANLIATCNNKDCKLIGLELDVEPSAGSTINSGSGGFFLNVFNKEVPVAFQTGGVSGGSFANGIILYGLKSTAAGLAPGAGTTLGSLINSGAATYNDSAILLNNLHTLRLNGTAAAHAYVFNDAGNRLVLRGGSVGTVVQNNAGTLDSVLVTDAGYVGIGSASPGINATAGRTYLTLQGSTARGVLQLTTAQADGDAVGLGNIEFKDANNPTQTAAIISSALSGSTAGNRGGTLAFATKPDGGSAATRMTIDRDGNTTLTGTLSAAPGGTAPAWKLYQMAGLANGVGGCANPNGCWSVNGGTAVNQAAGLTQDVVLFALPAKGYVDAIRIKTNVVCGGPATANTGLGTTANNVYYRAQTYDIQAVVSDTNKSDVSTAVGSDTAASTNVVGSLVTTVNNVDQIADTCKVDYWVKWGTLP